MDRLRNSQSVRDTVVYVRSTHRRILSIHLLGAKCRNQNDEERDGEQNVYWNVNKTRTEKLSQ